MNKNIYSIIILSFLLVGMNYINAWTGPATSPAPTNAPNNNVAAPVNIGGSPQVKTGGLGVAAFTANKILSTGVIQTNTQMNSPLYCDENGDHCFNIRDVVCPAGHAVNGIMSDGSVSCIDIQPPVAPPPPLPVYSWSTGSYGSCSATTNKCGQNSGYQTRTVVCRNSQGSIVSDSNCSASKPASQISCSNTPCSSDR